MVLLESWANDFQELDSLRDRVLAPKLESEGISGPGTGEGSNTPAGSSTRRVSEPQPARPAYPRGRRELSTPRAAYEQPILEALVEMGGAGDSATVLERVEKKCATY